MLKILKPPVPPGIADGVVLVDALGLFVKLGFCFVFLKVVLLHPFQTRKAIQGTFLYGIARIIV